MILKRVNRNNRELNFTCKYSLSSMSPKSSLMGIFPVEDQCKSLVGYNEFRLGSAPSLPENRVIPVAPAAPSQEPRQKVLPKWTLLSQYSRLFKSRSEPEMTGVRLFLTSVLHLTVSILHGAGSTVSDCLGLEPSFLSTTQRSRWIRGMEWDRLDPMGRKSPQNSWSLKGITDLFEKCKSSGLFPNKNVNCTFTYTFEYFTDPIIIFLEHSKILQTFSKCL